MCFLGRLLVRTLSSREQGSLCQRGFRPLLDVTDPEPLPSDNALWHMPNVIITPHVSAYAPVADELRVAVVRANLRRYVTGEPMLSVVEVERGPQGLPAGAVGEGIGLVPSSLTFHLQALQRAGLVVQRREGRQLIYSADFDAMNGLLGYLTENCCAGGDQACAATCKPLSAPRTTKRARVA